MNPDVLWKKSSYPLLLAVGLVMFSIYMSSTCFAADTAGELSLAEGLKMVSEQNRAVRIASYGGDMSSADVLSARSRFLPGVNASVSRTALAYKPGALLGPLKAYTSEKDYFSYGINFHQTLYDFGATTSQYEASKESLERARSDIARIRNLAALDFILAYYDILESGKMSAVAAKEVESLESHLSVAENLYREGVITKNDLLQTGVRLADARQRLISAGNARALSAIRINNILDRPLTKEVKVAETVKEPSLPVNIDSLRELAQRRRPEFAVIDREIKMAELDERTKRSEYYPRIFAEGGYNYSENRYLLHDENWALIVGLNVNLFSGGATEAAVAKARHRKEQLEERKAKLTEDVGLELEKSLLDMKNASEKTAVSKDAVGQAEENLRINKVRYEEGVGTATDVLDAIALHTNAETNYYRALYDLRRADATLMYASGANLVEEYR